MNTLYVVTMAPKSRFYSDSTEGLKRMPIEEAHKVAEFARRKGFTPRILKVEE